MCVRICILCNLTIWLSISIPAFADEKCDQTPIGAKVLTPTQPKDGQIPFELEVDTKGSKGKYMPDQTYVEQQKLRFYIEKLEERDYDSPTNSEPENEEPKRRNEKAQEPIKAVVAILLAPAKSPASLAAQSNYKLIPVSLKARYKDRPFTKFMITAEDPGSGLETNNELKPRKAEVGSLTPLQGDRIATYSGTCLNTVINIDNTDKQIVTVHWISPKSEGRQKTNQPVRFRAMAAEDDEVWYAGSITGLDSLSIILEKDDALPADNPPLPPLKECNLCSEARYEVIFEGKWSRGNHPLNFPEKPDEIAFETMIGASHHPEYTVWAQGKKAGTGVKGIIIDNTHKLMQEDIIANMSTVGGTRTLIRGKRRGYPYTSVPQHALFRVDRVHHMFSVFIQMRPSPDWFLGTYNFELCSNETWLESHQIPLYPWDAGLKNGVSYNSPSAMTMPEEFINRVGVGSFDEKSPFFQMNQNDLKAFAILKINRLDVYPLTDNDCAGDVGQDEDVQSKYPEGYNDEEAEEEPRIAESRTWRCFSEWSEWSPCQSDTGTCGLGTQMRAREELFDDYEEPQVKPLRKCYTLEEIDDSLLETRKCFVPCQY